MANTLTYVATETQASIGQWADATFGQAKSLASIAARANREMAELVQATVDGASDEHLALEAADVAICLYRYAHVAGGRSLRTYAAPEVCLRDKVSLVIAASRVLHDLIRESVAIGPRAAERYVRAANVIVHLRILCRECGAVLEHVIDEKMKRNRARKWVLDGNGHGQHVEGT